MKILYISNFKDGTGWSHAAVNYVLALDAAGIPVVPRNIKLNNINGEVPSRISELMSCDDKDCDIVIQHVLPHMMEYNGRFKKNIGIFFCETDSLGITTWADKANLMDEIWVCCQHNRDSCLRSGISVPVHIIPCPTDTERFERKYETLPIKDLHDNFVFYFIGEAIRRKNITALLKAYHLEFAPEEPVSLLIKTTLPGHSAEEAGKKLVEQCKMVKDNLKLYPHERFYHREIVITKHMSEEEIMQVHAAGDCFVMPSYGEAWCIPAFDAMSMGKTPICSYYGGMPDYIHGKDGQAGWLVQGRLEPVFGMTSTFIDLNTGRENWFSIDVEALRTTMREAYENKDMKAVLSNTGINRAYEYSHAAIGNLMEEILNG